MMRVILCMYQVNIIQLEPANEHLRDTIFFNIFRNSILFDELHDALEYRRYLVRNKIPPPKMYTLGGDVLDATAVLDPNPTSKLPVQQTFVFGEQRSRHVAIDAASDGNHC